MPVRMELWLLYFQGEWNGCSLKKKKMQFGNMYDQFLKGSYFYSVYYF